MVSPGYASAEVMTGGNGFGTDREKPVTAPAVAHVSPATQYDPSLIEAFFGMSEPDRSEPPHSLLQCPGPARTDGKEEIDAEQRAVANLIGSIFPDTVIVTVEKDHMLIAMYR